MWPPSLCPLELSPGPIGTSNWLIRPPIPLSPPQLSSLPGPGLIAGSHPGSVIPHDNEHNLQLLISTHHTTAFVNLLSTERLSFVSYEPRARDIAASSHRQLTFLACPIVDGGVAEDEEVLLCCREVGAAPQGPARRLRPTAGEAMAVLASSSPSSSASSSASTALRPWPSARPATPSARYRPASALPSPLLSADKSSASSPTSNSPPPSTIPSRPPPGSTPSTRRP